MKQDKYVHDLREHAKVLILDGNFSLLWFLGTAAFTFVELMAMYYYHSLQEIYTIKWSPTGPGTSNPYQQLILAR